MLLDLLSLFGEETAAAGPARRWRPPRRVPPVRVAAANVRLTVHWRFDAAAVLIEPARHRLDTVTTARGTVTRRCRTAVRTSTSGDLLTATVPVVIAATVDTVASPQPLHDDELIAAFACLQ